MLDPQTGTPIALWRRWLVAGGGILLVLFFLMEGVVGCWLWAGTVDLWSCFVPDGAGPLDWVRWLGVAVAGGIAASVVVGPLRKLVERARPTAVTMMTVFRCSLCGHDWSLPRPGEPAVLDSEARGDL